MGDFRVSEGHRYPLVDIIAAFVQLGEDEDENL
jgi:hypothetical protein